MYRIICLAALLVSIAFRTQSVAAGLKDAKPVFKSGNWTVLRSTDAMTDKTDCTGIYKENYGIQLVKDSLYVTIRGGIQSVTLRFGENPPKGMRLPGKMEKDVGTVIISGNDFSELTQTIRLRLQVLTLVRGVASEDLDTTGIQAAVENINSGCPVQAEAPKAQSTATPESLCSDQLISRMRANGLKDVQIQNVCQK